MRSVLNQICALYVLAAGTYTAAIVFEARPDWAAAANAAGREAVRIGTIVYDETRLAVVELSREAVARIRDAWNGYGGERHTPAAPPAKPAEPESPVTEPAPTDFAERPAPADGRAVSEERIEAEPGYPDPVSLAEPLTDPEPAPVETAEDDTPPPMPDAPPELRPAQREDTAVAVLRTVPAAPHVSAERVPVPVPAPGEASAPSVELEIVPPEPQTPRTSPAEIARVEERVRLSLTRELAEHFDLFLYVSKAERGPWAQRMYVFAEEGEPRKLTLLYDWPVSTGREQVEFNESGWRLPTYTPAGYYQLDPKRFYRRYTSMQWGSKMPYAMFFDWVEEGRQSGLAIHGVVGEELSMLGRRASAGCIRLAPEHAQELYTLIRKKYRGDVPRFAFDRRTQTMSNEGVLMRGKDGRLRFVEGYRVLVFIEDYGGEDVIAALF